MELNYSVFGQGQALTILHGLLGMSDNWVGLAKQFAQNYKVILPDLRNHGRSGHSPTFSYMAMCDDVDELLYSENIPSTYLMGHSMGGKVAMQFALDNPQMVEKLIVVDISPNAYQRTLHPLIEAMLSTRPENFSLRSEVESALSEKIKDPRVLNFLLKNLQRTNQNKLVWKTNIPVLHQNTDEILREINAPEPFTKPVLFIKGSHSDYIQKGHEALIFQLFPNASIQTIENASHWTHADQPEVFTQMVFDFLAQ